MGASHDTLFALDFNRSVKVEAREQRLTGHAGALLTREVLSELGIGEHLEEHLDDPRDEEGVVHPQVELFRTALLLASQGCGT